MATIKGNTSGSVNTISFNIASKIVSFSLANISGGAITVSVGIFYGSTITYMLFNKTISMGESYVYSGNEIILPKNHQIYINVSGSTDYYFSIQGVE